MEKSHLREVRSGLMPMDNIDSLANEDVADEREKCTQRRERAVVMERNVGQVVNFQP